MTTTDYKYGKLINETNRLIKSLSFSIKHVNPNDIRYLLFHRHGVCQALIDPTTSPGEMLIISRFLNLIFAINQSTKLGTLSKGCHTDLLISMSSLTDSEFNSLIFSLLKGLEQHLNCYYWTTAFVILNQDQVIEFICQSNQLLDIFYKLLLSDYKCNLNIIKSTLLTISHMIINILAYITAEQQSLNDRVIMKLLRVICHCIVLILDETGINNSEMKNISSHLRKLSSFVEEKFMKDVNNNDNRKKKTTCEFFSDEDFDKIFKKLNAEQILNNVGECIAFIRSLLPLLAKNFLNEGHVESICKTCIELLQRTIDPDESLTIMTTSAEIVYFGTRLSDRFFYSESNLRAVMGFIKILPSSIKHSDARLVIWWHILCSMSPQLFQLRYKQYFIPFLENILGQYLESSSCKTKNYGISEYNLSNGHMNLCPLANHVIINILDCLEMEPDSNVTSGLSKNLLVPNVMLRTKIQTESLQFDDIAGKEFKSYIIYAVNIWINILRTNSKSQPRNMNKKDVICKSSQRIPKYHSKMLKKSQDSVHSKYLSKSRKLEKSDNVKVKKSKPQKSMHQLNLSSENDFYISEFDTPIQLPWDKSPNSCSIPEIDSQIIVQNIKTNSPKIDPILPKLSQKQLQSILKFFSNVNFNQSTKSKDEHVSKSQTLPIKKRKDIYEKICPSPINKDNAFIVSHDCNFSNSEEKLTNELNPPIISNCNNQSLSPETSDSTDVCLNDCKDLNQNNLFYKNNRIFDRKSLIRRQKCHQSSKQQSNDGDCIHMESDRNNNKRRCKKVVYKNKLPKSHIDFVVNITETTKPKDKKKLRSDDLNDVTDMVNNKNRKVEFRIKFDLDPITAICCSEKPLGVLLPNNNIDDKELNNNNSNNDTTNAIEHTIDYSTPNVSRIRRSQRLLALNSNSLSSNLTNDVDDQFNKDNDT